MDNPKLTELFDSIADEIRNKRGTTAEIKAANFPEEIALIDTDPSAGTTASASDLLEGKTAYSNKTKLTGTMPNNGSVVSIIDTQGNSYTIPKGYHDGTGAVTANINTAKVKATGSGILANDPVFNNNGFDISITATTLPLTIESAGYISDSTPIDSVTNELTKTLDEISVSSAIETSGDTTIQPVIDTNAKDSNETFTDAYSGTIIRGTTPDNTDPYVKVKSSEINSTIKITPTSKVINDGYGTTTQFTSVDTAEDLTISTSASQDTYIPIKKGAIERDQNQINITSGWLDTSSSFSIDGAEIVSGVGIPSATDPEYNSTTDTFDQTLSGSVYAYSITKEGYISDTIGQVQDGTMDEVTKELNVITIDNDLNVDLTKKPSIEKIAKTDSETWLDASGGNATTDSPAADTPYVKVKTKPITEDITVTPKVTVEGYGNLTHYNVAKNSYNTVIGATASDDYYIPIQIGSVKLINNSILTTEPYIGYSNGEVTITARGEESIALDVTPGYIAEAEGGSVSFDISGSKSATELDSNLKEENIKSGVNVFGVDGTYICPTDTNNPATSGDILINRTAYQGNKQVIGSMPNNGDTSSIITKQGGTATIPKGYTSGGTVTANINNAVLVGNNSEATISDPTINSGGTKFTVSATGMVLPPTVSTAGYIDASTSVSSADITGSKELSIIAGTATASSVTLTPTIEVSTEDDSSYTWINAASSATATESPSSGNIYTKITIPSASKDVAVTKSITTAGYGTSANNNITVNSGKASLETKTYYAQVKRGSVSIPTTTKTVGLPSISYNSDNGKLESSIITNVSVTSTVNEGYVLQTDSNTYSIPIKSSTYQVDPSKVLPSAEVTIAGNKVTSTTGWITNPDLTISSGTLTSTTSPSTTTVTSTVKADTATSSTWTNVASGVGSATIPTSAGYYVKIDNTHNNNSVKLASNANVTKDGYLTSSNNTSSSGTVTIENASSWYVPVKGGSITLDDGSIDTSSGISIIYDSTNKKIKATVTGSKSFTAKGNTGYITSSTTDSATISVTGTNSVSPALSGAGLEAGNIKSGATVFGVSGTFTSDGTATASQILSGYKAYSKGSAVSGSMTDNGGVTKTLTYSSQSYTIPAGYHNGSGEITASYPSCTVSSNCSITSGTLTKGTPTQSSEGTITIPVTATGSESITLGINQAGWVNTAPTGGSASANFSGNISLTKADLLSIESDLVSGNILDGVTIFGVTGSIKTVDLQETTNTFTQQNNFSFASEVGNSSTTSDGTINITNGGLVAASGIKGSKVYNAVWNDLADLIPINDDCDLEYGKCYCFDGEKYYQSSKYLDDGIIGIHSDTAGFEMGHKDDTKELKCSVAGFVLAYVDKEYSVGTLLTCTENGYLTEIKKEDKINYPEKIVGSYWKNESEEYWGSEKKKVLVNGRKWVKVR